MAAELVGCSKTRIIFRHMVPSFISHIIAATTLAIPAIIISETSLSFLGLGLRPPAISWGRTAAGCAEHPGDVISPWLLPVACRHRRGARIQFHGRRDTRCGGPVPVGTGRSCKRTPSPCFRCEYLKTSFFQDEGTTIAVDGALFDDRPGKTLGIVGESGCGKSVTAQSILRIVDHPGRIVEGEIFPHPYGRIADRSRQAPGEQPRNTLDPRGRHRPYLPGADDLVSSGAHDRRADSSRRSFSTMRSARRRRDAGESKRCAASASRSRNAASTNTRSS